MKRVLTILLVITMAVTMTACGCGKGGSEQPTTMADSETVAINAGDSKVMLDEAKYYAYTSQATYEAYYISKNREIDWNAKTKSGATMQETIKGIVLGEICRRECMYAMKGDYNVTLDSDERQKIQKDVDNYFTDSSEKLKAKVQISKKRLLEVFQKAAIAEKIEGILDTAEINGADKAYKEWKDDNTVMAEDCWRNINFDEPIFLMTDVEWKTTAQPTTEEETEAEEEYDEDSEDENNDEDYEEETPEDVDVDNNNDNNNNDNKKSKKKHNSSGGDVVEDIDV